jgi:hypothetical protein
VELGPIAPVVTAAVDEGWFSYGEDTRLLGYGRGLPGRYLATEHLISASKSPVQSQHLVGVYADGTPSGMFWVEPRSETKKTVELHCYMAPGVRGKWVFHQAGVEIIDHLFGNGIYRVEAEPLRINKRAIALLRHYGFKQEAIKVSAMWMDGNVYDTVLMRLLKREWKNRKEN